MHPHTHPLPQGLSCYLLFRYLGQVQKSHPIYETPISPMLLPKEARSNHAHSAESKPVFSQLSSYSWEGTSTTHCLSPVPLFQQGPCFLLAGPGGSG